MARVPKVVARKHEADALAYKVANPRATWQEVADHVGLGSPGAAYDAVYRPIRKSVAANIEDMRDLEGARLDAMAETLWPIATGDVETALQWSGKGPNRQPVECEEDDDEPGHVHGETETGRQVCWVIPPHAQLNAIDRQLAIIKQKSDLYGLKHSDGIAERQQALNERQLDLMADFLKLLLDAPEVGMTEDQKKAALTVYSRELEATA